MHMLEQGCQTSIRSVGGLSKNMPFSPGEEIFCILSMALQTLVKTECYPQGEISLTPLFYRYGMGILYRFPYGLAPSLTARYGSIWKA